MGKGKVATTSTAEIGDVTNPEWMPTQTMFCRIKSSSIKPNLKIPKMLRI